MSNTAEVVTPLSPEDSSLHVSLGDCLSGEARKRLLSLIPNPAPAVVAQRCSINEAPAGVTRPESPAIETT